MNILAIASEYQNISIVLLFFSCILTISYILDKFPEQVLSSILKFSQVTGIVPKLGKHVSALDNIDAHNPVT